MKREHGPHHAEPGGWIADGSSRRSRGVVYQDVDGIRHDLDRRSVVRRSQDRCVDASAGPTGLGVRELCHDARQSLATMRALLQQRDEQARLDRLRHRRLVEELDVLSALLEGHLRPPVPVRVDLVQLADETVDRISPRVDVCLRVVADGHPVVTGDPVLLGRMLMNLVDNACRNVRPGGRVRVRVDQAGDVALVDVEDEGSVPLDTHLRWQSPAGQGLGLAVVQAAVARHGGVARVDGSALGGWQVQVRLPLGPGREGGARG